MPIPDYLGLHMPAVDYNKLLENESAAAGIDIIGDWQTFYGGYADLWVWGNLGGGTIKLEAAIIESAPCDVCGTEITGTTSTRSGVAKFNFNASTKIRAVLTGTTSPATGVHARINNG